MRKPVVLLCILIALFSSACVRQLNQMKRFSECDFKYIGTDSVVLAGVPMTQNTLLDNLSLMNMKTILNLFVKGSAPLHFRIILQAKNNNSRLAAMNRLDWILYIDEKKVLDGCIDQRVAVPGHDSTKFPVSMEIDLVKQLRIDNLNSLTNLTYSLLDVKKAGNKAVKPVHIKLMVRPSFVVGKKVHQYPNYITIIKDYEWKGE